MKSQNQKTKRVKQSDVVNKKIWFRFEADGGGGHQCHKETYMQCSKESAKDLCESWGDGHFPNGFIYRWTPKHPSKEWLEHEMLSISRSILSRNERLSELMNDLKIAKPKPKFICTGYKKCTVKNNPDCFSSKCIQSVEHKELIYRYCSRANKLIKMRQIKQ